MSTITLLAINLLRRKRRTLMTLLCIALVFFNYGLFFQMYRALQYANGPLAEYRISTTSSMGLVETMPKAYAARIAQFPGVRLVTYGTFFNSYYQAPGAHITARAGRDTDLTIYAADPKSWMDTYSEWVIPADQRARFLSEPNGILIGEGLARIFHWKVGDKITLTTTRSIYRQKDGSDKWNFVVSAIFRGNGPYVATFWGIFHHDYLDTLRATGAGQIGFTTSTIYDSADNARLSHLIDETFADTDAPTTSVVTNEFFRNFYRQSFNFRLLAIGGTAIGVIAFLLIGIGIMVTAMFERRKELAVMRALGFSKRYVQRLLIGETVLLCLIGGTCGLLLAGTWLKMIKVMRTGVLLQADVLIPAFILMIGFGLALGLGPAIQAGRIGTTRPLSQE